MPLSLEEMVTPELVSKELDKLRKCDLIDIIIKRRVPNELKISDSVRKYIEENEATEFYDSESETIVNSPNDLTYRLKIEQLKCELKCTKIESECLKRINKELESKISDKDLIISLIKNNKDVYTVPLGGETSEHDKPAEHNKKSTKKEEPKYVQKISSQDVSSAIREAHRSVTIRDQSENPPKEKWKTSSYKKQEISPIGEKRNQQTKPRSNAPLIGSNIDENCPVRVAPKKAFLHVYRLHPEMTIEEVKKFLQANFPEVEVEKLNSLHPKLYSSFKVTIDERNFDKAWNPNVWPAGAWINRFFHSKRKITLSA